MSPQEEIDRRLNRFDRHGFIVELIGGGFFENQARQDLQDERPRFPGFDCGCEFRESVSSIASRVFEQSRGGLKGSGNGTILAGRGDGLAGSLEIRFGEAGIHLSHMFGFKTFPLSQEPRYLDARGWLNFDVGSFLISRCRKRNLLGSRGGEELLDRELSLGNTESKCG